MPLENLPAAALSDEPIALGSCNYINKRVVECRDGLWLKLVACRSERLVFLAMFGGGGGLLAILLNQPADNRPHIALFLLSSAFLLVGTLGAFGWRAIRFDRTDRRMTYGFRLAPKSHSLGDIAAVQVLTGKFVTGKTQKVKSDGSDGYQPYELNVVLVDGERINLTAHAHLTWTRDTGRRLADFLGVPLVDLAR